MVPLPQQFLTVFNTTQGDPSTSLPLRFVSLRMTSFGGMVARRIKSQLEQRFSHAVLRINLSALVSILHN